MNENEEYSIVSSDNLAAFNWKERRSRIAVTKCVPQICPSKVKKCKKTLVSLCFRQLTTKINLMTLLEVSQTLTQLIFENVLFDEYKRRRSTVTRTDHMIDLPNLKELYFSASFSLTKNDYYLLDFFTRNVSMRKLDYFEFIGNAQAFRELVEPEVNLVMDDYGQIDEKNNNTVAKFLIRHRPSLRFIVIGGSNFKMFNHSVADGDDEIKEELKKMELTGLDVAMDDDGIDVLLESQQKLKSLVVTAITYGLPSNSSQLLANIFQCCENNYNTLVEFYFRPKLITSASREMLISQNIFETFTIDCSIFAHCPCLKYLTLGLTAMTSELGINHGFPDEQATTVSGTKLRNLHRLPKQLTNICLDAEDFNFIELELLANQFFKFTQLREFSFRANANISFLVRTQWVWVLFQHLKMKKIVFEGGILENFEDAMELVNTRTDISMSHSGSLLVFDRHQEAT